MTVKELIAVLQEADPMAEVLLVSQGGKRSVANYVTLHVKTEVFPKVMDDYLSVTITTGGE